jgi:hypothetical protein
MSQEILFLLFMTCELIAIVAIYTFWIIPRVSIATNNLFEQRMLDKTWDIPAMLEDYTVHLAEVFSAIIKKLVPEIMGGYLSAGTQQLKADPENILAVATSEFLEEMPLPMRLVASKLLPRLQEAMNQAGESPVEPGVRYQPGLDKR